MKVNGEIVPVAEGMSLSEWLAANGYDAARSAVLLNGRVVPRAKMGSTALHDNDDMEVVSFVGGG